jgi:hypothetical protein
VNEEQLKRFLAEKYNGLFTYKQQVGKYKYAIINLSNDPPTIYVQGKSISEIYKLFTKIIKIVDTDKF